MEGIMEILREMHAAVEATPPEKKAELMAKWNAMADAWLEKSQEAVKGVMEEAKKRAAEETKALPETTEACPEVTRLLGGGRGTNSRGNGGHGGAPGRPRWSDGGGRGSN
jgi:hypothetical protein